MCGPLQDVRYTSTRDIKVPCLLNGSVLYEVGSSRSKDRAVTGRDNTCIGTEEGGTGGGLWSDEEATLDGGSSSSTTNCYVSGWLDEVACGVVVLATIDSTRALVVDGTTTEGVGGEVVSVRGAVADVDGVVVGCGTRVSDAVAGDGVIV